MIRVPRRFAERLIEVARAWDSGESPRVNELEGTLELEPPPLREVKYSIDRPVNVSSVPQRSPFRYPGGRRGLCRMYGVG